MDTKILIIIMVIGFIVIYRILLKSNKQMKFDFNQKTKELHYYLMAQQAQDLNEKVRLLTNSLDANPKNPTTHYEMALTFKKLFEKDKDINDIESAVTHCGYALKYIKGQIHDNEDLRLLNDLLTELKKQKLTTK